MDAMEFAACVSEGRAELSACPLAEGAFIAADLVAATKLDPRAVRLRLDRVMLGADPESALDALLQTGVLSALLPEVQAMVNFSDGEWRHKDVWKHTKQVVRQAECKLEVRWGALFHDIGKVKTRSISPDGKVQFLGHAEVGTRMFDKLERRLGLFGHEQALQSSVRFLVLHHLRAAQYDKSWTDSAVRRFTRDIGEHLGDLLCLSRADITTKRPEKKKRGIDQLDALAGRIASLAMEDAVVPPLPSGVGDEMMKAFGLKPSRLIGDIKRALEAGVESGAIVSHQPCDYYVELVRTDRARFGIPEAQ